VESEAEVLESLAVQIQGRKAELAEISDEKTPAISLSEAWPAFIASTNRPDSGEETLYQYSCQFSAFVDWMRDKHSDISTLRGVTKEIAEEYAGNLNHGRLSPSTCNKHLNLLTLVFRVLKGKAKIANNPWEDIQRKRIVTHSRRELTIVELRKVCQSAQGELRLLLALGVYSGLRLGDCATLRWAEVDLVRGTITRIPNKTARRNPKPVIVPIHPELLSMLVDIPKENRDEFVLPKTAGLYENRIDLVTDMVQRHLIACGIKPHKRGTGTEGKRAVVEVGFHSLRHTFVSLGRESNASLAVVESIVGHSNPAMTRHYTHVGELAANRAVAALPSVMGNEIVPANKRDPEAMLKEIHAMVKRMTAKSWRRDRGAILEVLSSEREQVTVTA
jgi:integrase